MKNKILIGMISFYLWACQKQITYIFPETMSESVKTEYLRQCIKGEKLFEINCAQCHTHKTFLSKKIVDFSAQQIYGYDIRMSNKEHESSMNSTQVSTEEIGYILSFLMYKKPSGLKHVSVEHR